MKKLTGLNTGLLLVGLLVVALAACSTSTPEVPATVEAPAVVEDITIVDEDNNTSVDPDALDHAFSGIATTDLSEAEAEGLSFMREEEKLARDVYLMLYEQWGIRIFQNIAKAEETHMSAVAGLLERYGLPDPAADTAVGVFTNPELQALYDQLMEEGSQSLADALRVGALVEEVDIVDLEDYIEQTDNEDLLLVYQNLLKGSYNHLRAFTSTLEKQTGEIYQLQLLESDA
ncbi:MAG: DUF2202 domain-containing protein [Chloroflexota bacterium]|nr:DUF2202 domain-containing protein [Chloroflexota bacterium]